MELFENFAVRPLQKKKIRSVSEKMKNLYCEGTTDDADVTDDFFKDG
jgi:hypothetical protein